MGSRASSCAAAIAATAGLAAAACPGAAAAPARAAEPVPGPTAREARVALIVRPVVARRRPGGHDAVAGVPATTLGGQTRLLVLGSARRAGSTWLRVRLTGRPNGAAGWIRRDDVVLRRTVWRIRVSLRERTLHVVREGRLVRRAHVVIGAPGTPTPTGLFAVTAVVRQAAPDGFLGPWALHLTAHSDVLDDYGGGPGTTAIHGRGGASLRDPLGTARSHGCIRITNRDVRWLAGRIRAGVPVRVSW